MKFFKKILNFKVSQGNSANNYVFIEKLFIPKFLKIFLKIVNPAFLFPKKYDKKYFFIC